MNKEAVGIGAVGIDACQRMPILELSSRSSLLRPLLLDEINSSYEHYYELKRMIYWADYDDIGVSFADPYIADPYMCMEHHQEIERRFSGGEKILNISLTSECELGRLLSPERIMPFKAHSEYWVMAYDKNGNRVDDVMLKWEIPKPESGKYDSEENWWDDWSEYHDYDTIENTFTNSPFNYLYIKAVLADETLCKQLNQYEFFTDGEIVNTRFGYYSPAYALALLKSLRKHSLCSVLRNFRTFEYYHPNDTVTSLCRRIAHEKYADVNTTMWGINGAKDMCHNYSVRDSLIEAEDAKRRSQHEFGDYDKDDYEDDDDYVDDPDPYYQEMEYWNTH